MAVVLLLAAHGVQAAPAFWQVKATKTTTGTVNNSTFSKANIAGNLIVVHVLWGNTGAVTLTDTANNTYTAVAPATRFENNQSSSQVFYAKNIAAAPANGNTLKATFGTSINNWAMVYAHEYSGMDKVSPVDVFGTTSGTGTTMTGSLTTHQNNSLIFAAAIAVDSSVNSADSSYTVHSKLSGDWTMSKVQTTAGAVSASASRSNGPWVLQMVAFKPDGTPPPNQPPSVAITNPANGSLVKGNLNVSASASDPENALAKVDFFIDGLLKNSDTSAPYEFNLDTATLTNATHSITAKASDGTNETTSAAVQITIDNAAPSVPANLRTTGLGSSQATLAWDPASDNLAVGGYNVFKDGVQIATTASTSYAASGLAPGTTYNFAVSAFDTAGNQSPQTAPLPVTTLPDNPPQITITSPAAGSTVRATIPVNTTASDDVGITQVELWVDGQLVIADTATPYEFTLDTTTLTNDVHVIKTKAFDTIGQTAEASVSVTVDNLAPEAPTNLAAQVVSSSAIDLSWTASTGDVAYYKVLRNDSEIATNVTATNYSDTGLAPNTTYNYAVKAFDAAGNESPVATVSVATPPVPDTTPPVLSNGQPTGQLPAGTTTTTLGLTTDETATCRYATVAGTAYDAMLPNSFTTTGNTAHSAALAGLNDGQSYSYFVRCRDVLGNTNASDFTINFSVANSGIAWPFRSSTNGRYLVDQNNQPVLIIGDSPQGLVVGLNLTDSEEYFQRSQDHGINTVWVNLLAKGDNGGRPDGSTIDGMTPFTTIDNLSTPRAAYFDRAAAMIAQAQSHNITVILDPIETINHLDVLRNNAAHVYQYGRFLGNRFKDFPNIIWMYGNDYMPNASDNALLFEVQRGIKDTDSPGRLHTVELYPTPNGSYSDPAWISHIDIDLGYTYGVGYDQILKEYNRSADPVIMIESHYDYEDAPWIGHPAQPPLSYRKQELWTFLSGGMGYVYGNYYTVNMANGWQTHMDTPAVTQLKYIKDSLLTPVAWYNLVPDQNHTFLTGGLGNDNGAFLTDTHAAAARVADGSLGMVYMPDSRTITIDMSKMNGSTTARWFDPTTGAFTTIGTYANTGSRQFTPPAGPHTDGTTDWVLVLETAPAAPDTEAPSVPGGLQASAASSTQINLNWTASTDNIAVTGYSVYRSGVLINGNVTGTTYQDTGLTANTTYSYTVSAHDAAGNNSAQSTTASATTQPTPPPDTTAPSVPTGLGAAVVSSNQINLSWTTSTDNPGGSGLKQYRVYRSTDNVQFTELTPFPTGPGFNSLNLAANTTYYYKAKAEDNAGNLSDFSATISATTQPAPPVSAYLKAAWGFNEGSGTATGDASGNNNTATINGASPWAGGKYGSGLSLNGAGNYLSMPNSSSLDIAGSEMTVSLWLNPQQSPSSDSIILGKFWNAATWTDPYYQYGLELWSGQPVFLIGTTTGLKYATMGSNVAFDGQWKHLTVVYNGADAKFYLNGTLVSTQPLSGAIVARGNAMNIGADQSVSQFFKGGLDDLRVYNKALTAAEITADMNTSL